MSQRSCSFMVLVVAGLVAVCASVASATIIIETVPVGNAGNDADTRYGTPGYGAVDYSYQMGKYEITAGQYTEFLNKVGGVDAYGLYNTGMSNTSNASGITRSGGGTVGDPYTYSVASAFVNRPVNYVSWGDSARFANWMWNGQPMGAQGLATTEDGSYYLNGATSEAALSAVSRKPNATWAIPTEDEWYKAAYYKGGSTNAGYWSFPTSSDTLPGRDMEDVSGNNANYDNGSGPLPIDSPYYTTVIGEFQNSDSPYGTFDQGGNVWEWNEAVVLYQGDPRAYRGVRGAGYGGYGGNGSGGDYLHASFRNSFSPSYEDFFIGFRVSEVPEPATIVMLALASVGIRRRRRA